MLDGMTESQAPPGSDPIEVVRGVLAAANLPVHEQRLDEGVIFRVTFEGPAEQAVVQVHPDIERFAIQFFLPGSVDVEHRARVAEMIARVNWGLLEGAFILDFENGALGFKTGFGFSGAELSPRLVRNSLLTSMETIELFVQELAAVANGHKEPEAAYRSARARIDESEN
jgi:hypothetical protein